MIDGAIAQYAARPSHSSRLCQENTKLRKRFVRLKRLHHLAVQLKLNLRVSVTLGYIGINIFQHHTSCILSTKSTRYQMPLHLSTTSTLPDSLGIAKVNGFYGPGAWSGWFLTIVSS